jgi:RimJ/RimL family protein N-acetyltransferase
MSLPAAETPSCLPRVCTDKNGSPFELCRLAADDGQRLAEMYLAFQPRNSFQGLPPIKDSVCVQWVRDMLATGVNVIATAAGKRVVGHVALFPVNGQKCELLVVVSPGFQNLGIGTELVRSCVALAEELGFQRIWLPVDAANARARHVYRKCGFEYLSSRLGRELDMECDVRRRQLVTHPASGAVPRFHFPDIAHSLTRAETCALSTPSSAIRRCAPAGDRRNQR